MTRTLAVVPARAGSKRIPHKNQRDFLGRPLLLWTIDFALSMKAFDSVIVSTDSTQIAQIALEAGASVPSLRSTPLASDTAASVDVVLDLLERLNVSGEHFDRVALLQPTSPIRFPERWAEACSLMDRGASAVVGVRAALDHPYWSYFLLKDSTLEACLPDKSCLRSQDLPEAYVPNGSLYLIKTDVLKATRRFTPYGTRAVICVDFVESIDIDTEQDWAEAEHLVAAWQEMS
jgi:CMP-N-acetylneuraminic acid synthetase